MSTVEYPDDSNDGLNCIPNVEEGTVTFTPYEEDEITVPATEWLTISTDDLIDVRDHR